MKTILTLAMLLASCYAAFAGREKGNHAFGASAGNYNLVYHRINITITDPAASRAISNGSVTTYFTTTTANVSSIQFDLDCSAMTVSSVKWHGVTTTFTINTTTDVLNITLPAIPLAGTEDSLTVFYSGTPVAANAGVPSGYNYGVHNSTQKAIYTLGEPFHGHYWWPCKESLNDKIDSCVDLIVTAPSIYRVAGNGTVTEVASGANTVTTWKTRYPIATYMVNFALAHYRVYASSVLIGAQTLPLQNYLYPEDDVAVYQNAMNDIRAILPMYSTVLGVPYPFMNEKYGMAECTGNWGALEVQSMTFIARNSAATTSAAGPGYDKYTIAHEIAHQWFANSVTTNDWHQIWLNEGFAQYFESVIYPENLDVTNLSARRSNLKTSVADNTSVYVNDISTPNSIFSGADQPYAKGAMLLSMLRTYLGDTRFFLGLKNYLSDPAIAYGFTSIAQLEQHMEATTPGLDLANFFSDWINKKGYSNYTVNWATTGKLVKIKLVQTPTVTASTAFETPIPIRITGTGVDTTVIIIDRKGKLYNNTDGTTANTNTIVFSLSAVLPTNTALSFDPANLVLGTATSITKDLNILPLQQITFTAKKNRDAVAVNWRVEGKGKLKNVAVERSADGQHFSTIITSGCVEATPGVYTGSYTDMGAGGVQLYRLKIGTEDGGYLYSGIETVGSASFPVLRIAPNPVGAELILLLPSCISDAPFKLIIHTATGAVVREVSYAANRRGKLVIPVTDLPAGMYQVVLISREKKRMEAGFIKE